MQRMSPLLSFLPRCCQHPDSRPFGKQVAGYQDPSWRDRDSSHLGSGTRRAGLPSDAQLPKSDVAMFAKVALHVLAGQPVLETPPSRPFLWPRSIWKIVRACLAEEEASRPTFSQLADKLWRVTGAPGLRKGAPLLQQAALESASRFLRCLSSWGTVTGCVISFKAGKFANRGAMPGGLSFQPPFEAAEIARSLDCRTENAERWRGTKLLQRCCWRRFEMSARLQHS